MNARDRLRQLMQQRGLSVYMLAKKSDLTWNTVDNILRGNGNPTVQTLGSICEGLEITLAQFFDETGDVAQITAEQRHYLNRREALTERDRKLVDDLMDSMLKNR